MHLSTMLHSKEQAAKGISAKDLASRISHLTPWCSLVEASKYHRNERSN